MTQVFRTRVTSWLLLTLTVALVPLPTVGGPLRVAAPVSFSGMCDASAAVALSEEFFVVANDEDNLLRIYKNTGGRAVQSFDISSHLGIRSGSETDLEAAAVLGDTVFWIGSHGRNKKGKESPDRRCLFATRWTRTNGTFALKFVGNPYRHLLADLIGNPDLRVFGLEEASRRAPKERGGLNIEGLCATPDGRLLVAFRNPIPNGKALVIPIMNPDELIAGGRAKPGTALLLNLGGLGIRDLVRDRDRYLVLAGAYDGDEGARLFEWDGVDDPVLSGDVDVKGGTAEALVLERGNLLLFTDSGGMRIGGTPCKDVPDPRKRFFHGYRLSLER